jgi:hypothetical protein
MTVSTGESVPSITVDGQTYLLDSLSDQTKQLVTAIAATQQELNRLQTLAGITQTALQTYSAALKEQLSSAGSES